jgi:hypothetical protein
MVIALAQCGVLRPETVGDTAYLRTKTLDCIPVDASASLIPINAAQTIRLEKYLTLVGASAMLPVGSAVALQRTRAGEDFEPR